MLFLINILLYRWSAEHCMHVYNTMFKPPRNFKHFKHLRFMCVYITRYVLLMLCIIISERFLKAFFCTLCVFCFIFLIFFFFGFCFSCNDLGKMLYKNETRPTHDLLLYCVSVWVRSAFGHYHLSSAK